MWIIWDKYFSYILYFTIKQKNSNTRGMKALLDGVDDDYPLMPLPRTVVSVRHKFRQKGHPPTLMSVDVLDKDADDATLGTSKSEKPTIAVLADSSAKALLKSSRSLCALSLQTRLESPASGQGQSTTSRGK